MSLIFDIIRGNLKGALGKHVYDELGVRHGDGNCYLDAVSGMVNGVVHNTRSQHLKIQQQKRRTPCKVSWCESIKHYQFGKDGLFYKHSDKSKKRLCNECH